MSNKEKPVMLQSIDCPSCGRDIDYVKEGKNYPCERCGILWRTTQKIDPRSEQWKWQSLGKFSARPGSVVLRRWKIRETSKWDYGLIKDWRPVGGGDWEYDETSEFMLVGPPQ
jgi:predicted RNA-binding Zn-ribbon protein involved in translation (DUF1610 family)